MIMTPSKLGIDYVFNFIKDIYDKTRADILFNDRRLNYFFCKIKNKRRVSAFTAVEHCTGYSIQ